MVEIPTICRYCGGAVHLVPAAKVYGPAAAKRLGLEREKFYQCQNCNARVGCHKGSTRPLGNLANEALRMKRMETHQVFDNFWKERGMSRTQGYKWMAKKLRLSEELAHIGGFEMDRCQKLIRLCEKERNKEKRRRQHKCVREHIAGMSMRDFARVRRSLAGTPLEWPRIWRRTWRKSNGA